MYKFAYQKNTSAPAVEVTKQIFDQAIDDPRVAQTCQRISEQMLGTASPDESLAKQAQEKAGELKRSLPAFCWHATFKDNKRNAKNAIPSGLVMLDIDHIDNPQECFNRLKDQALTINLVAAHITPSGQGLRLVFVSPQGMSIPDAQSYLAQQLNVESDPCVKDLSRISFMVPRPYWLYINYDALFSDSFTATPVETHCRASQTTSSQPPQPPVETERAPSNNAPQKISRSDRYPTPSANVNEPSPDSASSAALRDTKTPEVSNPPQRDPYPTTYNGIPYKTIVQNLEALFGGAPPHGRRNQTLFKMACQLRYICNDDPEWIAQILPTYGEAESKWRATINSACKREMQVSIGHELQQAIRLSELGTRKAEPIAVKQSTPFTGDQKPKFPDKLPQLIEHLIKNVPEASRSAVSTCVFPALATHLYKVLFPLIDGTFREPIMLTVLMSGQSTGKSGIRVPIDYVMADIVARDEVNRKREKEWKREYVAKGNNKDKPSRPDDLIVQKMPCDFTNASLVEAMVDAAGHPLFSFLDELEMLNQFRNWSKGVRLSFDAAEYGQQRVSANAVSDIVNMRWNIVACTTMIQGIPFFRNDLLNGTLSRFNFSILESDESKDFIYGRYTEEYAETLKPFITNLNKASGEIYCSKALALARKLQDKCLDYCAMTDDNVMKGFVYRAVTIAYTKAMILYIAQGMQWDKTIEDYMEWSLYDDLWTKNHLFGTLLAQAVDAANRVTHRGRENLLDSLPDRFPADMVAELRLARHMTPDPMPLLYTWVHRGFITFDPETQMYEKTAKYKLKK